MPNHHVLVQMKLLVEEFLNDVMKIVNGKLAGRADWHRYAIGLEVIVFVVSNFQENVARTAFLLLHVTGIINIIAEMPRHVICCWLFRVSTKDFASANNHSLAMCRWVALTVPVHQVSAK